jgi:hypothetical protein
MEWIGRRIVPAKGVRAATAFADAPAMVHPSFHATSREGVRGHDYEKGDVIWLVSMLSGGSVHMPPAIDARIEVAGKQTVEPATGASSGKRGEGRYRFIADPAGARFFPWADASALVAEAFANNPTAAPWKDNPQALRTPRLLKADLAESVEAHASSLGSRPTAFLSYAWRESTPLAAALVRTLSPLGVGIWWDRWSMARSVVELRSVMPDLSAQLGAAIANADAGVCLDTPRWRTGEYTRTELAVMRNRGIPIIGEGVEFSRPYKQQERPTSEDMKLIDGLAAKIVRAIT